MDLEKGQPLPGGQFQHCGQDAQGGLAAKKWRRENIADKGVCSGGRGEMTVGIEATN